jgi:hypothetical protein
VLVGIPLEDMDGFIFSQQLHMLLLNELTVNENRVARRACGLKLCRDSSNAFFSWKIFFLLRNDFSKGHLETPLVKQALSDSLCLDILLF